MSKINTHCCPDRIEDRAVGQEARPPRPTRRLASIAQNRLYLHARILFSKVSIIMISKSDVFLFGASAIHNDRCD